MMTVGSPGAFSKRLLSQLSRNAGRALTVLWARHISRLPMKSQYFLLNTIVSLIGPVVPRVRITAYQQLRRSFPEKSPKECRRLALLSVRNAAKTMLEVLNSFRWTEEELQKSVTVEGIEHLDAALAKGKGVLLLTAHYGNWELMGARLAQKGYPLAAIAKKLHDPLIELLGMATRSRNGLQVIPMSSPLKALRALKQNMVLAILMDQNAGRRGIFVPFLWREASTFTGPALFAIKSGAVVLPAFVERDANDHHIGRILPPLEVVRTGDLQRDIYENTVAFTKAIEDQIRRHPEEWFWVHRRWKTDPRSAPEGMKLASPDCPAS